MQHFARTDIFAQNLSLQLPGIRKSKPLQLLLILTDMVLWVTYSLHHFDFRKHQRKFSKKWTWGIIIWYHLKLQFRIPSQKCSLQSNLIYLDLSIYLVYTVLCHDYSDISCHFVLQISHSCFHKSVNIDSNCLVVITLKSWLEPNKIGILTFGCITHSFVTTLLKHLIVL